MNVLRLFLVLLVAGGQAAAGAWPRGAGNTFVTFGTTYSTDPATLGEDVFDPDGFHTLLVERGVTSRLTFGLDAGFAEDGDYSALAYASYALGSLQASNRFALQAGLGMTRDGGAEEGMAQIGASWGRGLSTPWGDGWAAADASVFYRAQSDKAGVKLDLTLGVSAGAYVKLFMQVQSGLYPDADPYLRLVPSMAWEFRPGRHLEVGIPVGILGDDNVGLKVGTWLAF